MRGDKKGFGRWFYLEWLYPIKDYYKSSYKNEIIFENIIPIIVAFAVSIICYNKNNTPFVVMKLAGVLISLVSILIGFSIMLITLLLTSGGTGVDELKQKRLEKKLYNKTINLYQKLHIQFVYSLISEIFLMISIMLFYFITSIIGEGNWQCVFLFVFIFSILNILLSILRGITNVYFSYYSGDKL